MNKELLLDLDVNPFKYKLIIDEVFDGLKELNSYGFYRIKKYESSRILNVSVLQFVGLQNYIDPDFYTIYKGTSNTIILADQTTLFFKAHKLAFS